ncbi:MAG: hypothetical protein ASUL_08949 [Candidatus Aramenus sulfurataquae]|jgi:flagellar protein FlaG|uniref:Flagellar protein FlaG n=2 Tax=Candidatus Aramenus sulfurataquae TaxID=1326980 RepID=W7KK00_9CREN|nr:MAG: hypothetical protein ASUL_08949 [Candidatus Aramenus sulfurataquae]
MAGEVISEGILIIASIALVGILAGVIFYAITTIGSGLDSMSTAISQKLATDLEIIYATNTSPTEVVFYLQNLGQTPIYLSSSQVYFGKLYSLQPIGYSGTPPSWSSQTTVLNPGQTAEITISLSTKLQQNQDYEIMFVAPNGYETTYVFEVV